MVCGGPPCGDTDVAVVDWAVVAGEDGAGAVAVLLATLDCCEDLSDRVSFCVLGSRSLIGREVRV